MSPDAATPRKAVLSHSLLGYPPYHPNRSESIPANAEITILNDNHTLTDSLIEWDGREFMVNKESLITFEERS